MEHAQKPDLQVVIGFSHSPPVAVLPRQLRECKRFAHTADRNIGSGRCKVSLVGVIQRPLQKFSKLHEISSLSILLYWSTNQYSELILQAHVCFQDHLACL